MGTAVSIISYFPYDYHSTRSLTQYAKARNILKFVVDRIFSNSLYFIVFGDFNINRNQPSVRSDFILE